MHKKFIIANWKSAPATLAEARELVGSLDESITGLAQKEALGLVLCPPFIFLEEVAALIKKSPMGNYTLLGAQDIASSDSQAQTGEITGFELTKVGVSYVIVGHSERRWKLGESDAIVNGKIQSALKHNITPIVCVGERERSSGFEKVLQDQVRATFAGLSTEDIGRCILSYEPVWAISTTPGSQSDSPEAVRQAIELMKEVLPGAPAGWCYGGSVTSSNVINFLSQSYIDGVLVGGASIRRDLFAQLLIRAFKEL